MTIFRKTVNNCKDGSHTFRMWRYRDEIDQDRGIWVWLVAGGVRLDVYGRVFYVHRQERLEHTLDSHQKQW